MRDGAELEFLVGVRIELVGDEQHHRLLEQAVVEGSEELRREQGEEPPCAQQVGNVLDQSLSALGFMDGAAGIASFAEAAKPDFTRERRASLAEPAHRPS